MRQRSASITDLPISPDEERQRRFRLYLILMLVRVAALGVFFVVPDWWKLIPAFFAVFLPYFAVVIANATTRGPADQGRISPNALPAAPTHHDGLADPDDAAHRGGPAQPSDGSPRTEPTA
ncbi:hypothetical protein ABIB37_002408 [Agrococcus sp. UYP10]|uniref:DUF3099 domain-containing protein n=1 Tax=Agrococcus sp. UYP10 TaxID=1756355 RepID=UPI003399E8DB